MEPLTGACLCGRVRYEVTAPPRGLLYCHCTRCQRRTGTAYSVSALPAPDSVRVIAGTDAIRSYTPESGFLKQFCGDCGSQLFATDRSSGAVFAIRYGTVDDPPQLPVLAHQFTAYAASYQRLPDDGAPRFEERMPRS